MLSTCWARLSSDCWTKRQATARQHQHCVVVVVVVVVVIVVVADPFVVVVSYLILVCENTQLCTNGW